MFLIQTSVELMMPQEEGDTVIACAWYVIMKSLSKKRRRKWWWVRKLLQDGPYCGNKLLGEPKLEDGSGFRNITMVVCIL